MTAQTEPTSFGDKVKTIAGLLVAGFAGAVNFIGLKNDEVSTVLRNEAHWPTWVLALVVAGILSAVASIFVQPKSNVSIWTTAAVAGGLLAPVSLSVVLIRIPGSTGNGQVLAGTVVAICGGTAAIVCFCIGLFSSSAGKVSLQALLVFVSIALTATATYSALRLETVSQLHSTAAQLGTTVNETSSTASVAITIEASRLRYVDRVNLSVTGLLRAPGGIAAFCKNNHMPSVGTLTCEDAPCFTAEHRLVQLETNQAVLKHQKLNTQKTPIPIPPGCDILSSGVYQPDSDGSVRQTLVLPVSDVEYQTLELLGEVCLAKISSASCTYSTDNLTRVDIQLPKDAQLQAMLAGIHDTAISGGSGAVHATKSPEIPLG